MHSLIPCRPTFVAPVLIIFSTQAIKTGVPGSKARAHDDIIVVMMSSCALGARLCMQLVIASRLTHFLCYRTESTPRRERKSPMAMVGLKPASFRLAIAVENIIQNLCS